ncbi:GIY-YIG nuclease family protein [Chromobacterium sp. ASV23]|uniref:GIY-YIG nuclease family protein n=1 Tax=Chromobacterium sp. ASV23 TaxID=2795110 RepID=UPI0018ED5EEC|nr:GIY-YIG nuclease family protein [Chromobacterium sp. ASV23]
MEKLGFIYLASKPGFKDNLLKIGVSKNQPQLRLAALSKSTAAPAEFELLYANSTQDAKKVESRVHSLLKKYRFRSQKEYFNIAPPDAIKVIDKIIEYTNFPIKLSNQIGKSHDFINSHYVPRLNIHEINLFGLIMAATNDMRLRHIFTSQLDILDGFLDAKTVSHWKNISIESSRKAMRKFQKKAEKLEIKLMQNKGNIKIFKEINYHHGELWWLFTEEFIPHFTNDKI